MPRVAKPLTAIEIKRLVTPGLHAVGTVAGLNLLVKDNGSRSWVLRTKIGARRAELGLGGFPTVLLAQAIESARATLAKIKDGIDPAAARRANRKTVEWTFEKTALAYIESHRAGWRNEKHAAQWEATLTTYAFPVFGDKHVRDVSKGDVLAVIEPIWTTNNETAVRVRSRIELVLAYAVQREWRPEVVAEGTEPEAYLDRVMRGIEPADKLRIVAAKALLAFKRACMGCGGKKVAQAEAAKAVVSGRFAPSAPPKLVVDNLSPK